MSVEIETSASALLFPARPVENRVVHIFIEGITALDGSTLSGPITSMYTTSFSPMYTSTMRVRFISGEFLAGVSDDTINQLIWYFSMEADLKNYNPCLAEIDPEKYANFRARWVTAMVAYTLLTGTPVNSMMAKALGDLSVRRSGAAQELLDTLRGEIEDLADVLENGGRWGKGIRSVTRSSGHPDYPVFGRTFVKTGIPAANTKRYFGQQTKPKNTWRSKSTWWRR